MRKWGGAAGGERRRHGRSGVCVVQARGGRLTSTALCSFSDPSGTEVVSSESSARATWQVTTGVTENFSSFSTRSSIAIRASSGFAAIAANVAAFTFLTTPVGFPPLSNWASPKSLRPQTLAAIQAQATASSCSSSFASTGSPTDAWNLWPPPASQVFSSRVCTCVCYTQARRGAAYRSK